ncbi:M20/M25/M40 family metallo-hydrolase [Leifsonia shinshuensis]|uniref:M20/M25/M40 family metallo-hydrolase n=1 Tax=Leifsonia shinshuensis TaxID=150026 RepID=UPI001F51221B|nr:M20/M25/M40 family metallo-hydrolase [Leifsonia shinshuensis]MCI0156465.1 M20/M25/M40 family metallo-hydrolase [Leifsonia shinshuensis]
MTDARSGRVLSDDEVLKAVDRQAPTMAAVIDELHGNPELAHQEAFAAATITGLLEAAGATVVRGIAGMPTAFRAEIAGGLAAGQGAPVEAGGAVGIIAVYDAACAKRPDGTDDAVHSCGHGPQSAGVVGAALALASIRSRWTGRMIVIGAPADEIHSPGTRSLGSGKARAAAAGVFDDLDALLYPHPEFIDTVWQESLWMRRETAVVSGSRTLRSGTEVAPFLALDALREVLAGFDPGRVMVESAVLDGDVEEGSGLTLTVRVLVFDESEDGAAVLAEAVRALFPTAVWTSGTAIAAIQPDERVTAGVLDAFRGMGREPDTNPSPLPFATDFGNATRRAPGALVGVGRSGGWGFHTDIGADQFAGDAGRRMAADIARVVALSTVRLAAG